MHKIRPVLQLVSWLLKSARCPAIRNTPGEDQFDAAEKYLRPEETRLLFAVPALMEEAVG